MDMILWLRMSVSNETSLLHLTPASKSFSSGVWKSKLDVVHVAQLRTTSVGLSFLQTSNFGLKEAAGEHC